MLGNHFYHGIIRKLVVYFGSMFNDIYVDRVDANGDSQQTLKVPIQYGPKERYLTRLQQNPDLLREVSMVFPRMAFELTNIQYDANRKLNTIGKNTATTSYTDQLGNVYNPVPYNFDFELSIISRNTEDALRIVEQILPFFTPQWTETLTLVPQANIATDTPIILNSVKMTDTYENTFESSEYVLWTLTFTIKSYLYGPVSRQGIIKDAITNINNVSGNINDAIGTFTTPTVNIDIKPGLTANGQPTSNASLSVPASQIQATDDYGFITNIEENI
jgi:hypothetical protein